MALLNTSAVLSGYYLLFDLFLAIFAPYFLTFISAMVMLSEIDEHVAAYLAVTPVRRKGYVTSRLYLPCAAFRLCIRSTAFAVRADKMDGRRHHPHERSCFPPCLLCVTYRLSQC